MANEGRWFTSAPQGTRWGAGLIHVLPPNKRGRTLCGKTPRVSWENVEVSYPLNRLAGEDEDTCRLCAKALRAILRERETPA